MVDGVVEQLGVRFESHGPHDAVLVAAPGFSSRRLAISFMDMPPANSCNTSL